MTINIKILYNQLYLKLSSKQFNLISLSILRIAIGLHVLYFLIESYPIKEVLWNNPILNKSYPFLYDEFLFQFFYFGGIVLLFIYTIGLDLLILKIAVYIYVYILYGANPLLLDGGNNILIIILFFMIFTNNNHYFSFFNFCKHKGNTIVNITHNIFFLLILIQICILYFFAGFSKAQGDLWLHGTALYYILNIDAFSMNYLMGLKEMILNSPFLLTLGAYTAIFLQIFFPFLVFNKYTKYFILIGAIFFHLSIIIFMGLVQFGAIMIMMDMQFLKDHEYKKVFIFIKNLFRKRNVSRSDSAINI